MELRTFDSQRTRMKRARLIIALWAVGCTAALNSFPICSSGFAVFLRRGARRFFEFERPLMK